MLTNSTKQVSGELQGEPSSSNNMTLAIVLLESNSRPPASQPDAQQLSHQCAVAVRYLLTNLLCDIIVWVAHEIFLLGTVDFE